MDAHSGLQLSLRTVGHADSSLQQFALRFAVRKLMPFIAAKSLEDLCRPESEAPGISGQHSVK